MFKRILVPLDGSALAEEALPAATEIATRFESDLLLLTVMQPLHLTISVPEGGSFTHLVTEMQHHAEADMRRYLKSWHDKLAAAGITCHCQVVPHNLVAETILDVAAAEGADTIVMSTHGRGGFSRWVYGSIADKVLRNAPVPVVLVRAKEKENEDTTAETGGVSEG